MTIRTKGIWAERIEDAPFCGALISAIDCDFNCKNCFNQHVKDLPTLEYTEEEIIEEVLSDPFHEGVILSGLEWTLQSEELEALIKVALKNDLEVILYTGLDEDEFKRDFHHIYTMPIYIKFGQYIESLYTDTYEMFDVKLHSSNQYIRKGF